MRGGPQISPISLQKNKPEYAAGKVCCPFQGRDLVEDGE